MCVSLGNFGLVGISSRKFSGRRGEFWSTNERSMSTILTPPTYSYTVTDAIPYATWFWGTVFGVIRQVALLREEFQIPKLTVHSELRRRAASRRALPRTSSL